MQLSLNALSVVSNVVGMSVSKGYILPTAALIESMDNLTGWSVPGSGAIALDTVNKVEGIAALRLQGNGVSATTPITTKNLSSSIAPGSLGVVARYVYNYLPRVTSSVALQFGNSGGTFNSNTAGINQLSLGSDLGPGGYWTAFHESEDSAIAANGAITQVRVRTGVQNAPYYTDVSTDIIMSNAKGRPTFVIGFDDGEDSAYDVAYPYMSARGMVGTLYIPTSNVGVSDSLTWGEITTLKNAGWAICLDGSPDDTVMTGKVSVAQAVSDFTSQWAVLTTNGVASSDMYHLCYPNGLAHVSPSPIQVAAMTGNGTTTVTFDAGANVTNGMTAYGFGIPTGTTVVSGGGVGVTSVVLSNTIPVQTKAAMFLDQSGEFYLGKLATALAAAGVKSGRITQGGEMYTRFGFGSRALETIGQGFSAMNLTQAKAIVDKAILRGTTVEFYIHRIDPDPGGWTESTVNAGINIYEPFFNGLIDYIQTFVDANEADVLTKPQWYDRDYGSRYLLSTPALIDKFPTTAGYTFSANTTATDYGSAGTGEGNVRLTGNGTSVTMFARKTTAVSLVPADMGVISWMVKRIGGSYNGLQSTMTRGANTGTVTFTDTATSLRAGRRWLSANQSEFGTFTGGAAGTVQYQISVNQAASYNADAVVGPMYYQAAGRPTILFTFDDIREETIDNVLPLMSARGMKATCYVVKNFVDGVSRMTLAELQTLYAAGWAMGTNTTTDGSITGFVDDAATVANLQEAKDYLTTNGMPGAVDHMALSNGAWSEARIAALEAAGMKTARSTFGAGLYSRFGFGDLAMTLPANTCTGQTLVALKALVDSAILRGTTQIFYLHDVSGAPTGLGTDITIFTDLIDYVKTKVDANQLDVLTISELWNRDHANTAPV